MEYLTHNFRKDQNLNMIMMKIMEKSTHKGMTKINVGNSKREATTPDVAHSSTLIR